MVQLARETPEDKRRPGLIDPRQEKLAAEGNRPIQDHLADFRKTLEAKGDTPDHVKVTMTRLARVIEACKAERIGELAPSGVATAVAELQTEGLSLRTCNVYLRAVKTFSGWLWRDRRIPQDPLSHLSSYNVQADRRGERRSLEVDELSRLVGATKTGPPVETIPGPDRAMMYILLTLAWSMRGGLPTEARFFRGGPTPPDHWPCKYQ